MITACPVWRPTPRPVPSVGACPYIAAVPATTRAMATSVVMQTTGRRPLLHFILFQKHQVFASRSGFGDFLGDFPIKRQFRIVPVRWILALKANKFDNPFHVGLQDNGKTSIGFCAVLHGNCPCTR